MDASLMHDQAAQLQHDLSMLADRSKELEGHNEIAASELEKLQRELDALDTALNNHSSALVASNCWDRDGSNQSNIATDASNGQEFQQNMVFSTALNEITSIISELAASHVGGPDPISAAAAAEMYLVNVSHTGLQYSVKLLATATVEELLGECCSFWAIERSAAFINHHGSLIPETELISNLMQFENGNPSTDNVIYVELVVSSPNEFLREQTGYSKREPASTTKQSSTKRSLIIPSNITSKEPKQEKVPNSSLKGRNLDVVLTLLYVLLLGTLLLTINLTGFRISQPGFDGLKNALINIPFQCNIGTHDIFLIPTNINNRNVSSHCNKRFDEVATRHEFWAWVTQNLRQALFTFPFQNDLIVGKNEILTKVRFRQVRVRENESCNQIPGTSYPCYAKYTPRLGSAEVFGHRSSIAEVGFVWETGEYLLSLGGSQPMKGRFGSYDASGFVVDASSTVPNKFDKAVQHLVDSSWIDTGTSAVFVNFVVYNPSTSNLAEFVFLTETSTNGLLLTSWKVRTVELVCLKCASFLAGWALAIILITCIGMLKFRYKLLRDAYSFVDVAILLSFVTNIVCLCVQQIVSTDTLQRLWQSQTDGALVDLTHWYNLQQVSWHTTSVMYLCLSISILGKLVTHFSTLEQSFNVVRDTLSDMMSLLVLWSILVLVVSHFLSAVAIPSQSVEGTSFSVTLLDTVRLMARNLNVERFVRYVDSGGLYSVLIVAGNIQRIFFCTMLSVFGVCWMKHAKRTNSKSLRNTG